MIGEEIYSICSNKQSKIHSAAIGVPSIICPLDDVPGVSWNKMLLMDESDIIDEMITYSGTQNFSGVNITRSSPYFFEVLPEGVNKGVGLLQLLKICGFEDKLVVSAGDFYNDIDMLRVADLGAAVENAQDEVKNIADIIVCDNNSGAISDIVELLKRSAR
jgi:hydroxymethylpyrimidine pyrophosphatase-like HAD family hydrolase